MKRLMRHCCWIGVALLAFAAGVVTAASLRPAIVRPFSPTEVQVKFVKSSSGYDITLEYEVVNGSAHALRYIGYGEGSNVSWSVMRGDRLINRPLSCGTGLAEHMLGPGESERFQVFVTQTGPARAGFEFVVGEARVGQTFWSDEIFVEQPPTADGN